ncbi:MAG: hypothetical protein DRI69_06905 [Bacteroidetes bacterium]|nr:MAG: hypothetical protein DRI69_06905 [Bacteroidota bacterium]
MPKSRRLAAIMFSDISGFTRLMGQDEQRTMQILEVNRQLHKSTFAKYNGEYLKEIGDGTLTSFASVADAVHCAIDIMRGAAENDYELRIGIHLGDVLFDGNDVFGDGVNIASRIETLAVPGSILVSEKVYDELRNKQDIQTQFLGKTFLKNDIKQRSIYAITNSGLKVPDPITLPEGSAAILPESPYVAPDSRISPPKRSNKNALFGKATAFILVIVAGVLIYTTLIIPRLETRNLPDDIVIAVFPFEKDSTLQTSGQIDDFFATGLSERLALVSGLTTISSVNLELNRTILKQANILSFSDDAPLLDSIRATHYIRGSVDSKVHIQLFSVDNKKPVWKRAFSLKDTAHIFDMMGAAITQHLHVLYDKQKRDRDPKVIALYIDALSNWQKRGDEDALNYSIVLLQQALKIDPDDAGVNGLLSVCYVNGSERFYYDFDSLASRILSLSQKALSVDPDEPYALLGMGGYYFSQGQMNKAKDYYTKAHLLAPGLGITGQALAEFALYTGDWHNALNYIKSASKVSPYDETILQFRIWCEMANGFANESRRLAEEFIRFHPKQVGINYYQWADYLILKEYDKAIGAIPEERVKKSENWGRLLTGLVYVDQNIKTDYDELLRVSVPVADEYLELLWLLQQENEEDKERARAKFSTMMANRNFTLINFIQTYPFSCFNTFRTDPQIQLIARNYFINLSEHPYYAIQRELRK